MYTLHNTIIAHLTSSLLLWSICTAQVPKTDILDCAEIQIQNANLHPALNGFYTRTQENYNTLPVFQGQIGSKSRYIWWNKYDEYTRWSIGSERFSSSIEGFMDNPLNEAWMLGYGRSWHVVNQQEWTVDTDLNVICSRKGAPQSSSNPDARPPPPRKGGRPPPRRKTPNAPSVQQVIRITGAQNNALNTIFYPTNQPYDNTMVYKTDSADRPIYIFHYSYDDMQRWYIGNTLGSDYDVFAFLEGISLDLSQDTRTQMWSEHIATSGEWNDNNNLKLIYEQNQFINDAQQKQPPLTRDMQDEARRKRRIQQQQQKQQKESPPRRNNNENNNNINNNAIPPNDGRAMGQTIPNEGAINERTLSADDARNERRRQMFRRVNKLDLDVEKSGKFESGINVRNEPDIIITGSDDKEINTVYFVQPVKYNEKSVYKSQKGSYLYFVRYAESDAARWQIGQPNGGVKNDQPISFVNADTEYPYDIATWQAWLVYDKKENDWVRQSRVNTYRGDCIVNIAGAMNDKLNGEYGILPVTHETRPVFERMTSSDERVNVFFHDGDAQYSRWLIGTPNGRYLDSQDISAFIASSALTVDGVSDFETWQEVTQGTGGTIENAELKTTGTCSKVKEHDWKRRRRQRAEERKRRKAMDAAKEAHCPSDMSVSTDPGSNTAVVHWQAFDASATDLSEDDYDIVYSDDSIAPGSEFRMGRTAVTYELKDKRGSKVLVKCDFVITVKDEEPPSFQCPGDLYLMTEYNRDTSIAKWNEPDAFDNSNHDIEITQVGGPQMGQTLRVGQYMISYQAKDLFGNKAICNFGLYVVDRQSPKIQNCPQSVDIAVYKDQNYAAFPEWEAPIAWDNVDGQNVKVTLIQGVPPGTKMTIPDDDKMEFETPITYEAIDSSDNAARCSFTVRLIKDMTASESGKQHEENHERIKKTKTVEESETQYAEHMQEQDEEWSVSARRLREERETKNKQRRAATHKQNNRGHRSKVHQENQRKDVHDFEESLRLEDELRDETNDEVLKESEKTESATNDSSSSSSNKKKKPMTRAERRRKRREDRERRRKERAARRGKNKKKSSSSSTNPFSLVFWSTMNFLWSMLRPWSWPLWLNIPLLLICMCAMAYGCYCVYDEIGGAGDYRRGRRVPRYNSWSYKIANMFNRKTMKQRV